MRTTIGGIDTVRRQPKPKGATCLVRRLADAVYGRKEASGGPH